MLIRDMLNATEANLSRNGYDAPDQIVEADDTTVAFSTRVKAMKDQLNEYLFTRFYTHHKILRMQFKAGRLLEDLFMEYVRRPSQLPPGVQKRISEATESLERVVCDYIAGMTDRFALDEHRKLFLPYEY